MFPTPDRKPKFKDEATMIAQEALLRFVYFDKIDRSQCRPFGELVWVDFETIFGPRYDCGTEHTFRFYEKPEDSGTYLSAMTPLVQRIPDPDRPGKRVVMLTVFLTSPELYPLFTPLDSDEMRKALASIDVIDSE